MFYLQLYISKSMFLCPQFYVLVVRAFGGQQQKVKGPCELCNKIGDGWWGGILGLQDF